MILICGNLNAGKTTFSYNFNNVLHIDDYFKRLKPCLNDLIKDIKSYNYDCCVEGLFYTAKNRIEILNRIENRDYANVCIFLNTSLEICQQREIEYRKRKISVVKYFNDMFEIPTYSEGWDDIIVITDNNL